MRNERASDTLQTTALVNEMYLRLVDVKNVDWKQRAQFFVRCAQMMRHILADASRARGSDKRGGGIKVNVEDVAILSPERDKYLLALDEALAAFSQIFPRQVRLVELRYFGGLGEEETAEVLEISARTARRDLAFAKAWLTRALIDQRPRAS
jgi:RNA polymerase sigma factor (TIGR02999 family)